MGESCSCIETEQEAALDGSLKTLSKKAMISSRSMFKSSGPTGSRNDTPYSQNIAALNSGKKYQDTLKAFLETKCLSHNSDMVPASSMNQIRPSVVAAMHRVGEFVREERFDSLFRNDDIEELGPLQSKTTGHTYSGGLLQGVPHGYGVFIGSNGVYIEGYFNRGFPDCKVIKVWNTLEAYNGEWSNGMRHGYGAYLSREAEVVLGGWEENKMHGNMTITDIEDSLVFEGKMIRNRKEGRCYFRDSKKGSTYVGDFRDGLFYGEGKLATKEGVFEGTFALGRKNGFGTCRKISGEEINGEWSNDIAIESPAKKYHKISSLESVETRDSAIH